MYVDIKNVFVTLGSIFIVFHGIWSFNILYGNITFPNLGQLNNSSKFFQSGKLTIPTQQAGRKADQQTTLCCFKLILLSRDVCFKANESESDWRRVWGRRGKTINTKLCLTELGCVCLTCQCEFVRSSHTTALLGLSWTIMSHSTPVVHSQNHSPKQIIDAKWATKTNMTCANRENCILFCMDGESNLSVFKYM